MYFLWSPGSWGVINAQIVGRNTLKQVDGKGRKMTVWHLIETAPRKRSLIMWGPKWINPSEAILDEYGYAYDPNSGANMHPQPTHWTHIPEPPNVGKEENDMNAEGAQVILILDSGEIIEHQLTDVQVTLENEIVTVAPKPGDKWARRELTGKQTITLVGNAVRKGE